MEATKTATVKAIHIALENLQLNQDEDTSIFNTYIPPEIVLEVFDYLSVQDLFRVKAVCREWKNISTDDRLWKKHLLRMPFKRIDNPNLHACMVAQKGFEYALEHTTAFHDNDFSDLFGLQCPFSMEKLCFFENILYVIKQPNLGSSELFIYNSLKQTKKKTSLRLSNETNRFFCSEFTFKTATSEFLIFKATLTDVIPFSWDNESEKFCVYDRTTTAYLWESDLKESYLTHKYADNASCIFSYSAKDDTSFTVRARNIRSGKILFEHTYQGLLKSHVSALSGILSIEYQQEGSQEPLCDLVYAENNEVWHRLPCIFYGDMDASGNILFIDLDGYISVLNKIDSTYEIHTLSRIDVTELFFANSKVWGLCGLQTITCISDVVNPLKIDCGREISNFKIHDRFLIVGFSQDTLTTAIYDLETGVKVCTLYDVFVDNIFAFTDRQILTFNPPTSTINIYKFHTGTLVNSILLPGHYRNLTYQDGLLLYQFVPEFRHPGRIIFIDFKTNRKWVQLEKPLNTFCLLV